MVRPDAVQRPPGYLRSTSARWCRPRPSAPARGPPPSASSSTWRRRAGPSRSQPAPRAANETKDVVPFGQPGGRFAGRGLVPPRHPGRSRDRLGLMACRNASLGQVEEPGRGGSRAAGHL